MICCDCLLETDDTWAKFYLLSRSPSFGVAVRAIGSGWGVETATTLFTVSDGATLSFYEFECGSMLDCEGFGKCDGVVSVMLMGDVWCSE